MPYVTMVRDGVTPSAIPAFNDVHHNMIVANYAADGGCLDNDDGSAWYQIHDNACLFGGHKSDFDGHSKWSFDNLHLYANVYGDRCVEIGAQVLPLPGFPDIYANNTCVRKGERGKLRRPSGERARRAPLIAAPIPFPHLKLTRILTQVLVPNAECLDLGQSANGFPSPGADIASRFQWYNNTVYSTNGINCAARGGPFSTMADFVSKGYESGPPSTFISETPSAATMVGWIAAKLANPSERIAAAAEKALLS